MVVKGVVDRARSIGLNAEHLRRVVNESQGVHLPGPFQPP
jgi:hypothetical protein